MGNLKQFNICFSLALTLHTIGHGASLSWGSLLQSPVYGRNQDNQRKILQEKQILCARKTGSGRGSLAYIEGEKQESFLAAVTTQNYGLQETI